jgi:hypothetical protein
MGRVRLVLAVVLLILCAILLAAPFIAPALVGYTTG